MISVRSDGSVGATKTLRNFGVHSFREHVQRERTRKCVCVREKKRGSKKKGGNDKGNYDLWFFVVCEISDGRIFSIEMHYSNDYIH